MVQILDTILEGAVSDENCCTTKSNMQSACEAYSVLRHVLLEKKIDHFAYDSHAEKEFELCEPECELDPVSAEVVAVGSGTDTAKDMQVPLMKQVQPKKSHKNRHKSLIDKALRLQQKQEQQQATCEHQQDKRLQDKPIYIGLSDLAADWSRYMTEPLGDSMLDSVSERAAVVQPIASQLLAPVVEAPPKHHRKKSMINKAVAHQRKEFSAQQNQLGLQEMSAPKTQTGTYCTLCSGRPNKSSCALCGFRS